MHRGCVVLLCGVIAVVQPVGAAQQIGKAVDARLRVQTTGEAGSRLLAAADPVFRNDQLTANNTGLAHILFIDDTKLVVGPNSSVKLDEFVFAGGRSASTVSVSFTKGALRFISGNSGSKAYSLRTPAGSIGVRGTAFDVTVEGGTTNVVLLRGQVNVCPRDGDCQLVRTRCEYVAFNRRGLIRRSNVAGLTRSQQVRSLFPLLSNARAIRPEFQGGAAGCLGSPTQPGVQRASVTPTPPNPPEPVPSTRANPGNTKAVGNAGTDPNGKGFGPRGIGRSDTLDHGSTASTASGTASASAASASGNGGNGNGGKGNGNSGGKSSK